MSGRPRRTHRVYELNLADRDRLDSWLIRGLVVISWSGTIGTWLLMSSVLQRSGVGLILAFVVATVVALLFLGLSVAAVIILPNAVWQATEHNRGATPSPWAVLREIWTVDDDTRRSRTNQAR